MAILPDQANRQVIQKEVLSLELDTDQVEEIIREWAKTRGFSHRCNIQLEHYGAEISETIEKSGEPS